MRVFFVIILIFLGNFYLIAQDQSEFTIKGTVTDSVTHSPMQYVKVYSPSSNSGTITDENGNFWFPVQKGDTLKLSFIGYREESVVIASEAPLHIYLSVSKKILNTVVVNANDPLLYNLIRNCQKSSTNHSYNSKTYFMLESYMNKEQVELIEAYYNGEYLGPDLKDLIFKTGRIALNHNNHRFLTSTETSRAFYIHELFDKNDYFPLAPTELRRWKMKKKFHLKLNHKYYKVDSSVVYVIDYQPKSNENNGFKGSIWIDSTNSHLEKITYKINDAEIHPFLPGGHIKQFEKVDLNITKEFELYKNKSFLSSINFIYKIHYRTKQDQYSISTTKAYLRAFDRNDLYNPPLFEFNTAVHDDYRKILAVPYEEEFWTSKKVFQNNSIAVKNAYFVKASQVRSRELSTGNNEFFKKGFLEHPYYRWSEKRVLLNNNETVDYSKYEDLLASTRYNLEAQIFLNYTPLEDTTLISTASLLDPFKSFYYFKPSIRGTAFINMYFDLVEIHRRKLHKTISTNLDKTQIEIEMLYYEAIDKMKRNTRRFIKEVDRCTRKKETVYWNDYIKSHLNIDNVKIFGLKFDE